MNAQAEHVYVVLADPATRAEITQMLASSGIVVRPFGSTDELLRISTHAPRVGCIVFDHELIGDDPAMWRRLFDRFDQCVFLVLTGSTEVLTVADVIKQGAEMVGKSLPGRSLLNCIQQSLQRARKQKLLTDGYDALRRRIQSLTSRERQVLALVLDGKLSKQIGRQLGISAKTVDVHRSHITSKLNVESVTELIQLLAEYRPRFRGGELCSVDSERDLSRSF